MSNVFWKDIFEGFQSIVFENKCSFMKKMFCIQPLWYIAKLDKFYTIYLVLTKNGLEMTFVLT